MTQKLERKWVWRPATGIPHVITLQYGTPRSLRTLNMNLALGGCENTFDTVEGQNTLYLTVCNLIYDSKLFKHMGYEAPTVLLLGTLEIIRRSAGLKVVTIFVVSSMSILPHCFSKQLHWFTIYDCIHFIILSQPLRIRAAAAIISADSVGVRWSVNIALLCISLITCKNNKKNPPFIECLYARHYDKTLCLHFLIHSFQEFFEVYTIRIPILEMRTMSLEK